MSAFTHAVATNQFNVAAFIVDATAANGTHTTIQAAITAAVSGQTIFIKPGTYTENLTLKAGVDLVAFVTDSDIPNVIINGKCTFTAAGTVGISGIELQTNNDYALSVTGSAASIVYIEDCYLNCANFTGIQLTSSSASSQIYVIDSGGNLATTGISYFAHSGAGNLAFYYGTFSNSANSTTACTCSGSGFVAISFCIFNSPISITSTAELNVQYSIINCSFNATAITLNTTATLNLIYWSKLFSGTSSALVITAGTAVVNEMTISSSNTNAITGAGTIKYGLIIYDSTSSLNNVSTQTPFVTQPAILGGTITQYNTLVGGASSAIASVSPGTAGQVLASNGASSNPSYQNAFQIAAFTFTYNLATASGTQNFTGLSFTPVALIALQANINGSSVGTATYSNSGVDDGTTAGCQATTGTEVINENVSLQVGSSSTAYQTGKVSAFLSNGFTITWTKTSTPAGTASITGIAIGYP